MSDDDPTTRPAIHEVLARAIADSDLSQEEVAAALGVAQGTVSKWTLGTTKPKPARHGEIEQLLNLPKGTLTSAWWGHMARGDLARGNRQPSDADRPGAATVRLPIDAVVPLADGRVVIVEAKRVGDRASLRMAMGQLMDYAMRVGLHVNAGDFRASRADSPMPAGLIRVMQPPEQVRALFEEDDVLVWAVAETAQQQRVEQMAAYGRLTPDRARQVDDEITRQLEAQGLDPDDPLGEAT